MRLFLAIDLNSEVRDGLDRARRELEREFRGWRWVPPANIHLTLRFLGEVPDERVPTHREAWERATRGCRSLRFEIGGVGAFPPRGAPRVLWCGVRAHLPSGELQRLASALEAAAREEGFAPERRAFRPHLTIARAQRGRRPKVPPAESVGVLGEVEAAEVVLLRSRLSPRGASYSAVDRFALGPSSTKREEVS